MYPIISYVIIPVLLNLPNKVFHNHANQPRTLREKNEYMNMLQCIGY